MPTTFYPRDLQIGIATYGNGAVGEYAEIYRGAAAQSVTGNTTAGGTWISLGYWTTKPLVGFSLSGTVSVNLRGLESNTQANASLGVRIYRWINSTKTLSASLGQASSTTELTTTQATRTATVTPTTTTFVNGDAIVFEVGIINIGTMGGGRTVTFFYNGPTAGASGDSFFTINPTVTAQRRAVVTE